MEEGIQQTNFEQPKKSSGLKILLIFSVILILIIVSVAVYFIFFKTNIPEGSVHWKDDIDIYCVDLEGKVDIYTKGMIKLYDKKGNEIEDPQGEIYEDTCFGENKVMEYSCNAYDIEDTFDCPNGCNDGACIK